MIENHPDRERTALARREGVFTDRRSYYSIAGHVYLRGVDRSALRFKVFAENHARGGRCAICGEALALWEGDLEHIEGGRKHARCDCWHTVLADGTVHTNVRRSCSMFARDSCHAKKHHRVLEWRPKEQPPL